MSITRKVLSFETHFTQVPNAWLRDRRLSRRSRGLLAELLSHRPGWRVSIESLSNAGPEGLHAIRGAIAELEKHGYLVRGDQEHDVTGKFASASYTLTEPADVPSFDYPMTADSPSFDYPMTAEPMTDNRTHKNNTSFKEDQIKEEGGSPSDVVSPRVRETLPAPFPAHCSDHASIADPPPCRACALARTAHAQAQIDHNAAAASRRRIERERIAEAARIEISACSMCDDAGYYGTTVCSHDPLLASRMQAGLAKVRQAIAPKPVGDVM